MQEAVDGYADWVHLAVQGDRAALSNLLMFHFDELSSFISARLPYRTRHAVNIEDLVQATLVHAIRGIREFEGGDAEAFTCWLKTIAERQIQASVREHLAKKRSGRLRKHAIHVLSGDNPLAQHGALTDRRDTPQRTAQHQEVVGALHIKLAGLPDSQRAAVCLHHLEGKTVAETAVALNRSAGAIRGLLQRARRSLREAMGQSSRWFLHK